jgi:hypothetical protein
MVSCKIVQGQKRCVKTNAKQTFSRRISRQILEWPHLEFLFIFEV